MTNPFGRSFLSYRRSRAEEARILIEVQHEFGIPTWQDVTDLANEPLVDGLRRVIGDSDTANGILWLTPDVDSSPVITRTEVPLLLDRHRRRDKFFLTPCVAGGLQYEDARSLLASHVVEDFSSWNLERAEDPLSVIQAQQIVRRVLRRRVAEIHRALTPGEPLLIRFYTRKAPPRDTAAALVIDWTHAFNRREATDDTWRDRLLPALQAVAHAVETEAPGRQVVFEGFPTLSSTAALGFTFLATRGVSATWLQRAPDGSLQEWSLTSNNGTPCAEPQVRGHSAGAKDLAVLLSLNANVERLAPAALVGTSIGASVSIGGDTPLQIRTPGDATATALSLADAIRRARNMYGATGTVHVFAAAPAGLVFLFGQLSNTFGAVQMYEHAAEAGCYQPAVSLAPS